MLRNNKKIKIFDHCWHISHQTDMLDALANECEFDFCINATRRFPPDKKPPHLNFVTHYKPNYYDFAILHVDQRSIDPHNLKSIVYHQFNTVISDIPKVVINHGSPVYPEWIPNQNFSNDLTEEENQQIGISEMKKVIGENIMVVNSFSAASEKEWGFGIPIVHGISPKNWIDAVKEPRVFSAVSPGGMDRYYNRSCLQEVKDQLLNTFKYTLYHANDNINTSFSKQFYRDFLGTSLLYLDTSTRTPMNRARTEAFLSGCCVIQVEGAHDLELWAKPGENIVIVPNDPVKIAETIADFLENRYQEAIAIGQKGKEMAIKQFSPQKYRESWLKLMSNIIDKK